MGLKQCFSSGCVGYANGMTKHCMISSVLNSDKNLFGMSSQDCTSFSEPAHNVLMLPDSLGDSVAISVALSRCLSLCKPLLQYDKQHHTPAGGGVVSHCTLLFGLCVSFITGAFRCSVSHQYLQPVRVVQPWHNRTVLPRRTLL